MNIFLISCDKSTPSEKLSESARYLDELLLAMGERDGVAILKPRNDSYEAIEGVFAADLSADVIPLSAVSTFYDEDFPDLCFKTEMLCEMLCVGTLCGYRTAIIPASLAVCKAFMASAFHISYKDALAIDFEDGGIRHIQLAGKTFFDFGPIDQNGSATAAGGGGKEIEKEPLQAQQEEKEKVIINYFQSNYYSHDSSLLKDELERKLREIRALIIERKALWTSGLDHGVDLVLENNLLNFINQTAQIARRGRIPLLEAGLALDLLSEIGERSYDKFGLPSERSEEHEESQRIEHGHEQGQGIQNSK